MLNAEYWKSLAIKRRLENKAIKSRLKELSSSRDIWKEKALRIKKENINLQDQVSMIKKNLSQIQNL
jgi:hypothetical protein